MHTAMGTGFEKVTRPGVGSVHPRGVQARNCGIGWRSLGTSPSSVDPPAAPQQRALATTPLGGLSRPASPAVSKMQQQQQPPCERKLWQAGHLHGQDWHANCMCDGRSRTHTISVGSWRRQESYISWKCRVPQGDFCSAFGRTVYVATVE